MTALWCYGCGKPPHAEHTGEMPLMEVDGKWWHPECESVHRRRAYAAASAYPDSGGAVALLQEEGGL